MVKTRLDINMLKRPTGFRVDKFKIGFLALNIFWYLALFPGRLGFDYSEAVRMMRRGESTDWWTSEFWWYLKLTTFNGNVLYFSSFILLLVFAFSVYFLVYSLPINNLAKNRTLLIYFSSPIYGGFALNVSHDVFQAAGIILFIGIQLRHHLGIPVRFIRMIEILASFFVMTTAIGPLIIGTYVLVLLFQKKFLRCATIVSLSILVALISSLGVREVPKLGFALPIFGDIKCIVQHPDVQLTNVEWKTLEGIADKELWLQPKPCSLVDVQIEDFNIKKVESAALTSDLIKLYIKLVSENPAIFMVSHFQRASQALPPPFFKGPQNQIDFNPNKPLGISTNTALQEGTELLHPSVDESSIDMNVALFKPFEVVGQTGILIINQASWFWGWGGLWLWPILLFGAFVIKIRRATDWIKIFMPIIAVHGFLVVVLSAPHGRYVMATITIGIIFMTSWIVEITSKEQAES